MKLLRKLNTKIAVRFMLVMIMVVSILGTIPLFDLIQMWLDSGNLTQKNLLNALTVYVVTLLVVMSTVYGFYFIHLKEVNRFKVSLIFKALINTVFMIVLMPGYLYFQEVYKIDATLFVLVPFVAISIISLASFSQRFTDQEFAEFKTKFMELFNKSQGGTL